LQQEDIRTIAIGKEPKMKKILKRLLLAAAVLAVLALAGCDDDKGPMQTAGEKADNAVEKSGEAVKDAAKTTGNAVEGAAETTGDAVKGAAEKTGDAVGNATK
jgi:predicted small lipoprotein YifL